MRKAIVMRPLISSTILSCMASGVAAAGQSQPTRTIVYKTVGDVTLNLHVFQPPGHQPTDKRPAIVFFFGGGWNGGSPTQFYPHCAHLAEKGVFAAAAEYRVKSRNGTSPFECVQDGKSAVRFLRANAAKLGLDPQRIAAGGGSAGGHVAAATATVTGLNEIGEDTSVSERPNALVLFNPVYDNGPQGVGYSRVQDRYREISPLHNIRKGIPPAIVFLGTNDSLIPVATAETFEKKMEEVDSRSELKLFEGATHGFFNYGRGDGSAYHQTVAAMDEFLDSLGYFGSPRK